MIRTIHCLLACLVIFSFVGCNQGRGLRVEFVTGTVTLDGEPVEGASVQFIPLVEEGLIEPAGGITDARGVYRLSSLNGDPERGAVEGEYQVLVSKSFTEAWDSTEASGYFIPPTTHLLPEIYRTRDRTPLRVTVNRGRNTIDLALESR